MRKYLIFILLLIGANEIFAQLHPRVDERIELVSIVFCLSEASEYSNNDVPQYAEDIYQYFTKYKNHSVVKYAKYLRTDREIGYNAVASVAMCMDIEDGQVKSFPQAIVDSILDHRWTKENYDLFLKYVDDFYRVSDFNCFFKNHRYLYMAAEQSMSKLLDTKFKPEWFLSFYGKPLGTPSVYIGVCNGPHNYSVNDPTSSTGAGIIIGAYYCDDKGYPSFQNFDLFAIIHEFCHHFSNPLVLKYWERIEASANTIYPHVKDVMLKYAYGDSQTVMIEWFNNLCVIMYYRECGMNETTKIAELQERGFVWLERGCAFLRNFENNRDIYLCLEDFMPQIIGFLDFSASNFDCIKSEFNDRSPYVTSVYPSIGTNLYQKNIDEVKITFSRPMAVYSYGVEYLDTDTMLPFEDNPKWIDNYTIAFHLKSDSLKPNKTYEFKLPYSAYLSQKNYPMKKDFTITYNTFP